jgi:hypothetical protein
MVKVLIYSSKELFDKSSYEGRAEAHVITYRCEDEYVVVKNRTSEYFSGNRVPAYTMDRILRKIELREWESENKSYMQLMKTA